MEGIRRVLVYILTWEARLTLMRHKPKVIAVTGSVGKTSTKDAIYAALAPHLHIRKSDKSFNSEIGVPLTILGCDNAWRNPLKWAWNVVKGLWAICSTTYPDWLVVEVGADRPGDIRSIARWLRPDIAVLTGVSEVPVHVEYFDSPAAVLKEKKALAEHLRSGGKVIVNGDNDFMKQVQAEFRGATLTYGFGVEHDFVASGDTVHYEMEKAVGMNFRLSRVGASLPIEIRGALGRPRIYAALAALATAEIAGVDLVSAARSIRDWEPTPGRLRLIDGVRGALIIDDTYNSSPAAAIAALDTLKSITARGRKIAVLGDMLELGKYSADSHRKVGVHAAHCANLLATVGFRARAIAEAALDEGMRENKIRTYEHDEARRAGKELELELKDGDIVLVKGSQSMRMERTVKEIMQDPMRAGELLVRQDAEWLAKE